MLRRIMKISAISMRIGVKTFFSFAEITANELNNRG